MIMNFSQGAKSLFLYAQGNSGGGGSSPSGGRGGFGPGRGRMQMGAPTEKAKDSKKTLGRLLNYFAKERGTLALLFVLVAISVVLNILAPALLSQSIDAITMREFARVPRILLIMISIYLISSACTFFETRVGGRLSMRIVKNMRSDLFAKIVDLPVSYLDRHSHGDLMSRMTNDAENVSNVISQSMSSLFSGAMTLVGTILVMLWYSWQLTLLSCSVVIFSVLFTQVLSKLIRKYYLRRQQLLGNINGIVEEKVSNFKTVTAYNQQIEVVKDFAQVSDELTKTGIIAEVISSSMGPVMNMLNNVSFVVVAVFGAYFAIRGYITVGVISAFIVYSKQFSRPINELSQLYGQIQTAIAGAERVFSILDTPSENKEGSIHVSSTNGVIEFKDVNFSYVPGKQVIKNFNLKVESGKKIALVGSTGSGKTTIVNLLMRFYDIDSGTITLDGINIKDIPLPELRNLIGIVLQDTVLFTDTLRNNLAYAAPEADRLAVFKAAHASGCDQIAKALPHGYSTVLTDSGDNLSQGQRQLVTIGRAFLSYPNILILDEATSNIDTRTEISIQNAMYKLMEGRTSLIIAHRLSTIRDADTIVVMDQGSIVETGSHQELLAEKGRYYDLYMTQFAGQET
ncbi:MAG: ABC transporter ATP-binding protein [Firmicutes bacterium]|nr:ABC transporter ATP-binding protein [Bacillota bacterium]